MGINNLFILTFQVSLLENQLNDLLEKYFYTKQDLFAG